MGREYWDRPPKICCRCGHMVKWSSVSKSERKERKRRGKYICGMCRRKEGRVRFIRG